MCKDGFVWRTGVWEHSFLAGQPVPLSDPRLFLFMKNKGNC